MKIQEKPDYLIFADSAKNGECANFPDVSRGWGVTIDQTASKPPMEWMNGAFNRIDKNMLYLLQQGIPEWSEKVIYPVNAIIKYNGVLYIAIVENDDAKPSTNTTKWKKIQADFFNALPAVKTMTNEIPTYEVDEHVEFKKRPKFNDSELIIKNDFTQSFYNSGYAKLPNGLFLQWGVASYLAARGSDGCVCAFYTAFPNRCLSIVSNDGYAGAKSTATNPISNTHFKCWGRNPIGGELSDVGLFYIAIGY